MGRSENAIGRTKVAELTNCSYGMSDWSSDHHYRFEKWVLVGVGEGHTKSEARKNLAVSEKVKKRVRAKRMAFEVIKRQREKEHRRWIQKQGGKPA